MRRLLLLLLCTAASLTIFPACRNEGGSAQPFPSSSAGPTLAPAPPPIAGENTNAPIPDAKLASAIEEAFAADPVLHSQAIRVSVLNGDLTLNGTARSLGAKGRAVRLAGSFKGVTSLTNRIVVDAPSRPDAEIATCVDEAIKGDPATRNANVKATANGGTVEIRGSADSWTQRELLRMVASRVPGVQQVNVAVDLSHASARGDAEIAADVSDRFGDDARLGRTHIEVAVHGRNAALSGVVGSLAQRDAAAEDAWVAGVANVDVQALRVDWRENERVRAATERRLPTDAHIASAVNRSLSDDLQVGVQVPTVLVEHDVVTLSGNVMDFRAKNAADRDARLVSGVLRVEDRTTALPAMRQSDATIQKQVMWGVYNDVAVPDARNIRVKTASAKVTLQGAVASQEEKKVIERDAEEVPGVVAMEDDLQVQGYGPQTHVAAPEAIRHRAIEDIFWDPRVEAGRVAVDVGPDGDVTLSGVVDSWGEARAASNDAVASGAAHVIDRIRVADTPVSVLR